MWVNSIVLPSIFFLPFCRSFICLNFFSRAVAVRKCCEEGTDILSGVCELVSSHHIPLVEYDLQKMYHFTGKKSVSIHQQHSKNVCIFVSLFFKEPYLLVLSHPSFSLHLSICLSHCVCVCLPVCYLQLHHRYTTCLYSCLQKIAHTFGYET